ncbi:ankyrin repeat-containing domain protein [Dunaliella salina]|uniref:Ankyrin repeat-containing domain protein n=1 Tax=Dunaliella salina TaxID=3046 RepID=A0ABQ7GGB8_DUNSA|nr:ankyrin repeat-containing domain protein [Dunaliella salina]|eukprot:KAF5833646.1 ankyrin repeat-containing domain protein [Dunaliella salina]
MKQLLDDGGARGRTPLWIACYCNNEEAVTIFAREGANPWLADKHAKKTPLMMACVMGHAGCVKNLLDNMHQQFWVSPENGCTRYIDARSVTGFPALTYAVTWNHANVVEVLLQYGPSLTVQNPTHSFESALVVPPGSTPLHVAGISKATAVQSLQLQQRLSKTQSDWGAMRAEVASTSGVSHGARQSREAQHAARAAQREQARKQREEQRQRWLCRYQLHQALMHANSSSMENLQVLDNNQPLFPVSMARSSELGGSSWEGSAWGGSSPINFQGISGGASPRWQGALGINFTRPTIGEERVKEEDVVQDVASPRPPGYPHIAPSGGNAATWVGCQ